jgi:hypothetical protein
MVKEIHLRTERHACVSNRRCTRIPNSCFKGLGFKGLGCLKGFGHPQLLFFIISNSE